VNGRGGYTWPLVALAAVLVAGIVAVLLTTDATDGRSGPIIIMLVSAIGALLAVRPVTQKVDQLAAHIDPMAHVGGTAEACPVCQTVADPVARASLYRQHHPPV